MPKSKGKMEEAMRDLLAEKPYHEITVNDIVEKCGVHRNTFYYNYRDIPQLLNEVIRNVFSEILKEECTYETPEGWVVPLINYVYEHRDGILHLYLSPEKETLSHYLREYTNYVVWEYLRSVTSGIRLRESEMSMLTCFYSAGLRGLVYQWMDQGLNEDYMETLKEMGNLFDRSAIENFVKANM